MSGPGRCPPWFRSFAACLILVGAAGAGPLAGQTPDPDAPEVQEEPPMAEAPRSFRLSVTGSALMWAEDGPGVPGDGSLWGLDLEHAISPYLSFRLGAAYGRSDVSGPSASFGLVGFLAEIVATGRLALPDLREAGVVPFGSIGVGSLVLDPDADDNPTRSQNAFILGTGIDVRLSESIGARGEWRHYDINLNNLLEPTDPSGTGRRANRILGSLYWKF